MEITHDDVRRFQAIWREEFDEDLSIDDARHHIGRLDALFLMLARRPAAAKPVTSEDDAHQ